MVWYNIRAYGIIGAMRNPFRYGIKVTGGSFYGRRGTKASMLNVIDGGSYAVPYGSRRYGKSSLVAGF